MEWASGKSDISTQKKIWVGMMKIAPSCTRA